MKKSSELLFLEADLEEALMRVKAEILEKKNISQERVVPQILLSTLDFCSREGTSRDPQEVKNHKKTLHPSSFSHALTSCPIGGAAT